MMTNRKASLLAVAVSVLLLSACSPAPVQPPSEQAMPPAARQAPVLQATGKTQGMKKLGGNPVFNLEKIGNVMNPLAQPSVTVSVSGPLTMHGWAVDAKARKLASGVEIAIDGTPMAAQYPLDRADVAKHFKVPAYGKAGFELVFTPGQLAAGSHSMTVRVIANDGSGYYESIPLAVSMQ
jgi:hypothetical protein